MKTPLVVDIEAVGQPWDGQLLCIGYKVVGDDRATVWFPEDGEGDIHEMLADPERPKVTFTKYDSRWLRLAGWDIQGPQYDVQVGCWVLNENTPLSLEYCARRYCGVEMDKRIKQVSGEPMFLCDNGKLVPLADAPRDQLARYNAEDVDATEDLFVVIRAKMKRTEWWDYATVEEFPYTSVLLDMECAGMPVDLEKSERLREQLEVKAKLLEDELKTTAGLPGAFNLGSGEQMSRLLFSKVFELTDAVLIPSAAQECMRKSTRKAEVCRAGHADRSQCVEFVPPKGFEVAKLSRLYAHGRWTLKGLGLRPGVKVPSGDRPSTSTPALLSNMAVRGNEWVEDLLVWRKTTKVLTTYLRKFPRIAHNGRIYGRFNQTGTVTGRLSSSEPNLQNIPAHGELGPLVRALFAGNLIVGDYSQLEPRLMAHFSQDPFLLDVYQGGKDIYREVAAGVFGVTPEQVSDEQRGIGKVLVLSMGYGAGAAKVAQILTINGYPTSTEQAKTYLGELQRLAAVFFGWRQDVIASARRKGYVTTIGGRHRRLATALKDRTWKNAGYGERQAVNAVVQGSAGDIVRRAMMELSGRFPGVTLLAQVHDELVFEHTPGLERSDAGNAILAVMRQVAETGHGYELTVPLVFEPHFGASWAEAKDGSAPTWVEDVGSEEEVA